VAIERELLASDARSVRDDMFRFPIQRAREMAFPSDTYGLPALGEPETVVTFSHGLVSEVAADLGRRRPVAVAVGDMPEHELFEGLSALADWPAGDSPEQVSAGEAAWCGGQGAENREKAQTAIAMAFPAFPYGSPDRNAVSVLCTLLSGLAGRLFEELRERRPLAYTVAALPWLAHRAGAVFGYIATSPDREEEAREAMLTELVRVSGAPIDTGELERARCYAAGSVEVRRQSGRAVADEMLNAWMNGTTAEFAATPERLRAVKEADLRRVAAEVFSRDTRAEYVVRGGQGRV
jgi:zinc protease